MLFNSFDFAVFLAVVFSVYWLLRRTSTARIAFLLAASYFFYGYWNWKLLVLILFSTTLDYVVGLALGRTEQPRRRKLLISASVGANLGLLAFFKYFGFFSGELVSALRALGFDAHEPGLASRIVLPVGISFYTFQALSYTIDVYRREIAPERSFLRFAFFITFFPQLVAGPIVRARDFLPQTPRPAILTSQAFQRGLFLIACGLFKKVALADVLGRGLVDPFWSDPNQYGGWKSLLAIYGYAFQIYGDFSGYSDIAIGAAALFGFRLCENFDSPYQAASPREFWRRWHISLSTWLRDYLYLPLGGNRRGAARTYANLAATMLLGGLWHGASWMFVLWGAFHGALLIADRLLGIGEPSSALARWLRRLIVFHLICAGWILFRSADGGQAAAVVASLAHAAGAAEIGWALVLAFGVACATHFLTAVALLRARDAFLRVHPFAQGCAYALALGLIVSVHSLESPFIYFQF